MPQTRSKKQHETGISAVTSIARMNEINSAMNQNGGALPPDLECIVGLVEPGSRVLDLGCGQGDLLKALQVHKRCLPQGIEISEDCIHACVSKGLPVYHGDIDEGLADYSDQAVDYVIMTNVIQVLHRPDFLVREAARVGKKVIISFPNFAHWQSRLQLGLLGQMPRTKRLPYDWYDSPNIHLTTVKDFRRLLKMENLKIVQEKFLSISDSHHGREIKWLPNLRAVQAIFVLTRGGQGD